MGLTALRVAAVTSVYLPKRRLYDAIARLGFVQADPIRAPATAQDLILRHRVRGYRAGDLERQYTSSPLEEEYLYAYGFMLRATRALVHPRRAPPLSQLEKKVLTAVRERGEVHPRDLVAPRVVNAWGGYSKATTRALDALHYRGLLRVVRRDGGIRVYAAAPPLDEVPASQRLRELVMLVARVLAPISERTLRATVARYRRLGDPKAEIARLVQAGAFEAQALDGERYLQPGDVTALEEAPAEVRILAPFDPVVWDRRRFEHLWGWAYRTPVAKRVRGYYAMPLLWRDRVIGWVNADKEDVNVGFVGPRPRDASFRRELDAEIEALRAACYGLCRP